MSFELSVGYVLAALQGLALAAIGLGALIAPHIASTQYGIPARDAVSLALVRAMGVRDVVLGAVIALLIVWGTRALLGYALIAMAAVAIVDLALVASSAGAPRRALALHAIGGIALVVAGGVVVGGF